MVKQHLLLGKLPAAFGRLRRNINKRHVGPAQDTAIESHKVYFLSYVAVDNLLAEADQVLNTYEEDDVMSGNVVDPAVTYSVSHAYLSREVSHEGLEIEFLSYIAALCSACLGYAGSESTLKRS